MTSYSIKIKTKFETIAEKQILFEATDLDAAATFAKELSVQPMFDGQMIWLSDDYEIINYVFFKGHSIPVAAAFYLRPVGN